MRRIIDLNGKWELAGFDKSSDDWEELEAPFPIEAVVPGEVHPALEAAGIIADPYYGMNSEYLDWIATREWSYRRSFFVPEGFIGSRAYLEFDGLDTFATVILNDEIVGITENMFVPYRFDVTDVLLDDEENELEVRFAPAMRICSLMDLSHYKARYHPERIGARKMQCRFGWDWTPSLFGAGIWRGVNLVSYDKLSIRNITVDSVVEPHSAEAWINVDVENHTGEPVDALLAVMVARGDSSERMEFHATIPEGGDRLEAVVTIEEPELWWPNGLGAQPMYVASVGIQVADEIQDVNEQLFALRTVELRQHDEEGNPAFVFVINGVPVFAKGANWIPADHFPSRVTEERYAELIELAREAHFNMLRVWGGGIYEDDAFYDLCDQLGIMVWQDFMFSLGEYPETPTFAKEVEREAREVVTRLRNHPSIVLWCGNNECEISLGPDEEWSGKKYFHELIPRIVEELDGTRPYWPSSPYGGSTANSPDEGTYHGGAWFGTAIGEAGLWRKLIETQSSRFVAEFYAQGPPEMETVRRFIPENELLTLEGAIWEVHNPNNEYRQTLIGMTSQQALLRFVRQMMGEPKNAEDFVRLGGILQGEFVKAEIERHRTQKFRCAGSLFWVFNDTWPSVSYSLIDYYLRPKPAYYFAKRAFAPVILAFGPDGDDVSAWIVNDLPVRVKGSVTILRLSLRTEEAEAERIAIDVPINSALKIWTGPRVEGSLDTCVAGYVEAGGQIIAQSSYFFTIFREIKFPHADLRVERDWEDGVLTLYISTDVYARAVTLTGLPDLARPDDNYFDLLPGQRRQIDVRNISESEAEGIVVTQA